MSCLAFWEGVGATAAQDAWGWRRGVVCWQSAETKVVMQLGHHFVQFTAVEGLGMLLGVIRPGWDVEGGASAQNGDGHCFYSTFSQRASRPRLHHRPAGRGGSVRKSFV